MAEEVGKVEHDRQEIERVLDEYEQSLGIKDIEVSPEFDKIMNLTTENIRKASGEDCGEYAYILKQVAFNIQRAQNVESCRIKWAKNKIDRLVVESMQQFSQYAKYDEKRLLAIKNNEYATKLYNIEVYASLRLERLQMMSRKIDDLANVLIEQQKVKRYG